MNTSQAILQAVVERDELVQWRHELEQQVRQLATTMQSLGLPELKDGSQPIVAATEALARLARELDAK